MKRSGALNKALLIESSGHLIAGTLCTRLNDDYWPIDIEGAGFLKRGALLIGLRYPVTCEGYPLLMELESLDGYFDAMRISPGVAKVFRMQDTGDIAHLTDTCSLRFHGDTLHIITGGIDNRPGVSLLFQQHPEGGGADCGHYAYDTRQEAILHARYAQAHIHENRDRGSNWFQ